MRSQLTTFVVLSLIVLGHCDFLSKKLNRAKHKLERMSQKVEGVQDFLEDLESYADDFKEKINSIFHKSLVQQVQDEATGELMEITYSEFTFGEPSLVVGDAVVDLQFDFPHFDVTLSGIRFNLAYDFLVGPEESGNRGHAKYLASDLTLEFGDQQAVSESHARIIESQVEIDGQETQSQLSEVMNDFLTEKILHSLNEPFCKGDEAQEEPEVPVQRRNLKSFPSISLDLDKIINKIKEDPLTLEIEDQIENTLDHVEENLDKAKILNPTCEEYEGLSDREVESRKNFYQLMETVYVHQDAGEQESQGEDIFFWYTEIKEAVLNDAEENYVPTCSGTPAPEDQWRQDSCLMYRDVMRDFISGAFEFADVKECKLKQIERKTDFANEVKEDLEEDFGSLQKILEKAERKAKKATDKALKKWEDVLKFP